jgi:molybdenum cofactor cytidylyltransferase
MATKHKASRRTTGTDPSAKHESHEEEDEEDVAPTEPLIAAIVLAAGSSSRMGKSKQLLMINNEPLLLRSVKAAVESGIGNVTVVLGANEQAHKEILQGLPVDIVSNYYWKSGMGSSIKTGMNALLHKHPETGAVIIMVCDQPAVDAEHLRTLITKHSQTRAPIVASSYADTLGVPALFARPFFSNILILKDEQGAKKIITQFSSKVHPIDFPAGADDLDTDADLQQFLSRS